MTLTPLEERRFGLMIDSSDNLSGVHTALGVAVEHDPGYRRYIAEQLIPFVAEERARAQEAVDSFKSERGLPLD